MIFFEELTSKSWFEKIINIHNAIVFGLILVIASAWLSSGMREIQMKR
jgi:succinate dehydrogenase hydrophobic anchor subunit